MAKRGKGEMCAGAGSGVGRMEKAGHMMPAKQMGTMMKRKSAKSVHNVDVGFRLEYDTVESRLAAAQNRALFEKAVKSGQEPKPTKVETAFLKSRGYDVMSRQARLKARKANE